MQALIQQIVERTGVSEDTATQAVNIVIGYVKDRAPAPVAAQVENYLTGEGGDTDTGSSLIGAAKSALGGMFGKRGESKPDE